MLENFDELAAIFGDKRRPFPRNFFCGPREVWDFSAWRTMVESMVEIFIIHCMWRFDSQLCKYIIVRVLGWIRKKFLHD